MKAIKKALIVSLLLGVLAFLVACGGGNNNDGGGNEPTTNDTTTNQVGTATTPADTGNNAGTEVAHAHPDFDDSIVGELYIMTWHGHGYLTRNAGHQDFHYTEKPGGLNFASLYATARVFNEIWPNVTINIYEAEGGDVEQSRANFRAVHGRYPDIFLSPNITADIRRGMVADLTHMRDDPRFQRIQPAMLDAYTIGGRLFGIPWEVVLGGVYVNYELADLHNINPPRLDWNLDDFSSFVGHTDNRRYWGMFEVPTEFLDAGTPYTWYAINNAFRTGQTPQINLESEAVHHMLSQVTPWSRTALQNVRWQNQDPPGLWDMHWGWRIRFWSQNILLVTATNDWELPRVATEGEVDQIKAMSENWDYVPFPSTPFMPNTINVRSMPWVIFNYAQHLNNSPEWTPEAQELLDVALLFYLFYSTDTRAWEARSQQMVWSGTAVDAPGVYRETFATRVRFYMPIVHDSAEFNRQMQTLYSTDGFRRLQNQNDFPGWHKMLDIFQNGTTINIPFPIQVEEGGTLVNVMHEWQNRFNEEFVGAATHDAHWLDTVLAHLPEWNRNANERLARFEQEMLEAIARWY